MKSGSEFVMVLARAGKRGAYMKSALDEATIVVGFDKRLEDEGDVLESIQKYTVEVVSLAGLKDSR